MRSRRRNTHQRPTQKVFTGHKVLIVCEGKNTEYGYFQDIRRSLRLQQAQVQVVKPDGTDPLGIVEAARELRDAAIDRRDWNETDSAWAVFDGDEHIANNRPNWDKALALADKQKIKLAISNPSFEFWYLLHFKDHSAYLTGQAAMEQIKAFIKGYEKAHAVYKSHLTQLTEDAIARAQRLHDRREADGCERFSNPCAHVCQLVEDLLALKR